MYYAVYYDDAAGVRQLVVMDNGVDPVDPVYIGEYVGPTPPPDPTPTVERMTLLELVQQACYEMGIVPPTVLVANSDPQALQLFGLANRELKEQQQNREWTGLQKEWTIHVSPPVTTTGDLAKNSAVVQDIPDTSGVIAGYFVAIGSGIPVGARVKTVDYPTQLTLNMPASATGNDVPIVFARDTYDLPGDFDRYQNRTMWDRTNRWELIGPDSPQFDQWHRSGIVTVGPRRHFRQIGNLPTAFRLWPPPADVDTPIDIVFEYISTHCVLAADGETTKSKFTADDDMALLDEQAIILGIKWRFLQAKGLSYAAQQDEYTAYVGRRQSVDGGAATLNLGRQIDSPFLTPGNVQDGFFPSGGSGS